MSGLLEVANFCVFYGPSCVINNVNLSVDPGSVTVLLGANGAGKTSILRAICNVMVRTTGEIRFEERRIDRLATEAIARLGVAHVPDGRGTFVHMTVEENLRLGAYMRKDKARVRDDFDQIFGYFPRLKERLKQIAGTLSGGEQQMLAIGRALMSRPSLLLLDEPSFGLAPLVVREIFDILRAICKNDKVGMLLVEQNADIALQFSDRAYLLETGRIVMHGSSADLARDEFIRCVYLGY